MLERLVIRDLALVERAEVILGPGLNAVTGETGSGKSLMVQAIGLLVGGRADQDVVRDGADTARIEGEFRVGRASASRVRELLDAWGIDFDGETLIVRREVRAGGRGRTTVNQSAVTLPALRELGESLIDLHGQHEHQSLLRPGAGLQVLDRIAGLEAERGAFAEAFAGWRGARDHLADLQQTLAHFGERRAYLAAAHDELRDAELEAGEDERLRDEAARLKHADRLRALIEDAVGKLDEGDGAVTDHLGAVRHALDQAASLDASLAEHLPALEEARIAAAETARALARYLSNLDADPEALERIESRREQIARLQRKHQRDVPGLIAWCTEIAAELETGEDGEAALARARAAEETSRARMKDAAETLSRARKRAAGEWTARLSRELKPLGFARARLAFEVEPAPEGAEPGPAGLDGVAMAFSANPGEPPRPLQRIASGGELSRITLALKTALEAQDPVDLLLFDEVDSGIGGAVAQAVGERLRRLSRHRQIVCVTHLPMIASLADHHVRVTKHSAEGRTTAHIAAVSGDERIEEISRMLAGGKVTETTRRQARELLAEGHPKAALR